MPLVLGNEAAGVVLRVRVQRFKPSDEVYLRADAAQVVERAQARWQAHPISGPPDPEFAREMGMSWGVRQVMRLMSYRIRETAKRRRVSYSFLFMKASGDQLREIGCLIDEEEIRPVVDRVYPFDSIAEALAHVETGRAKGKVVVKLR